MSAELKSEKVRRPLEATVRPAMLGDSPGIFAIEKVSFATPWSRAMFEQELEAPHRRNLVATRNQAPAVVGFLLSYFVVGELHITNLAIHPWYRRRGIADRLLDRIFSWDGPRIEIAHLEVRDRNESAIRLYEKWGFEAVGIRKGYYSDTGEDAVVMVLEP